MTVKLFKDPGKELDFEDAEYSDGTHLFEEIPDLVSGATNLQRAAWKATETIVVTLKPYPPSNPFSSFIDMYTKWVRGKSSNLFFLRHFTANSPPPLPDCRFLLSPNPDSSPSQGSPGCGVHPADPAQVSHPKPGSFHPKGYGMKIYSHRLRVVPCGADPILYP